MNDSRAGAEPAAFSRTAAELAAAGPAGIPAELTTSGHLIYNSPAALDFNSPGAQGFGVKRAGLSVPGSIIAAIVLQLLPELMREFADYRMLLYAIVLILVMLATNDPRMREFFERLRPSNLVRKLAAKNKKEAQTDD